MAYIKNTWVDQDVERPKTYEVTNNQDGSITLTDSFGVVTELGTPVNADNMNHIEDGIAQCYVDLTDSDLSNLTETGEKHFLNKQQISNSVLTNNNSYGSVSGKVLTIYNGLTVLIADGLNNDGTLKNIEYTIPENLTYDFSAFAAEQQRIIYLNDARTLSQITFERNLGTFWSSAYFPDTVNSTNTYLAFSLTDNKWYYTTGSTTANWQETSIILLAAINVGASTLGVHYNHCTKIANSNMVDGEWEYKSVQIANNVSYPTSTDKTYDLSNYIHYDSFAYEVFLSATVTSGSSSSNHTYLSISTDVMPSINYVCGALTRTNSAVVNVGNIIIPTRDRKITIKADASGSGSFTLNLRAIRRLGANG